MSIPWFVMLFQLAGFAPPQAVDHVAHVEIVTGYGASSGDRSISYRSGNLIRIDGMQHGRTTGSTYFDLSRALVVSTARDRDGVVQTVTIGPPFNRPRRLPPTGRQDHAMGENCTIWRLTDERMGRSNEICQTADGILLWQAFWYPHSNNRTVMYERVTEVERRIVRPAEVLPPRNLLALALTPPPAAPATVSGPDYEVEMVGAHPADGSYVQRRHGRYFSEARRVPGERSLHVSNGAVSVSYSEDEVGRPLSLRIERGRGSSVMARREGVVPRWERLPNRAPEQLLSETCTWQENVAIQSTDTHHECRTADGITLKTESWFDWAGGPWRFTARRLSRAPLRDEDFTAPSRALDWGHWGITPAP